MGGRGSASGMSDKGKPYGTEHETLYQAGNIKHDIGMVRQRLLWKL